MPHKNKDDRRAYARAAASRRWAACKALEERAERDGVESLTEEERAAYAKHKLRKERRNEYLRERYKVKSVEILAQQRVAYAARPEIFAERSKRRYAANREYFLARQRSVNYGLSATEYQRLLVSQSHRCSVCKTAFGPKRSERPHVDHCHETKLVRGLLCGQCNFGIGQFKENIDSMKQAVRYLKAFAETPPTT